LDSRSFGHAKKRLLFHYFPASLAFGSMSVARLSIVIPVLGKLKKLEDTLVSVLENRPAQCEIIVVLNEPYADPYELAGEVTFLQVSPRAKLVACLNAGFAAARGDIIHTLGCGLEVTPGWTDAILPLFDHSEIASVAARVFDRSNPEKTLSTGVGYQPGGVAWRMGYDCPSSATNEKLPKYFGPDLLAGFYRKSTLECLGGLCTAFRGQLAGVDLALSLRFAGRNCIVEPNCLIKADRTDLPDGERLGSGCEAERLFWRWAWHAGWFRAGAGHTALLFSECLQSIYRPATLMRLAGRAWETLRVPFRSRAIIEPAFEDIPQEPLVVRPHYLRSLEPAAPMEISKAS
jgi:hypothetical protein